MERGESFYNPYLPKVVQDLEKKGLITDFRWSQMHLLGGFVSREGTPLADDRAKIGRRIQL